MRRATLIAGVVALLVAAPSALAASWERVADPAPAGASPSLAVLGGVPYLASVSPDGALTVSRGGASWTQVGGAINHDPAATASQPDLVATGSTLWVAWSEAGQIRVSKLVSGQWREVVGGARPINRSGTTGARPRMIVTNGVPYVTYMAGPDPRLDVVRLDAGKFQHITTGLSTAEAINPALALIGQGGIYIAYNQGDFTRVSALNRPGPAWSTLARVPGDFSFDDFVVTGGGTGGGLYWADGYGIHLFSLETHAATVLDPQPPVFGTRSLAVINGVRYAAGIHQPFDFQAGELLAAVFQGGAWKMLPSPADAGAHTAFVQLTRAGSTAWLTWISTPGDPDGPRSVHVARLVP